MVHCSHKLEFEAEERCDPKLRHHSSHDPPKLASRKHGNHPQGVVDGDLFHPCGFSNICFSNIDSAMRSAVIQARKEKLLEAEERHSLRSGVCMAQDPNPLVPLRNRVEDLGHLVQGGIQNL